MDRLGSLIIRQIFSESMKAGQMETEDNRRAVEAVEKEIENIARLRFSTAYEKRMKSLEEEMEVAKNELTLQGLGRSGALVKKLIALHSKAVRDTTFDVFHSFKEEYLRHYLSTSEQFLDRVLKAFEELIEDRFSERKKDVKEEVLRTGLGDSLLAWALNEMDEEKLALSTEVRREIEVLRSETKIQLTTTEHGTERPVLAELRKHLTEDQRNVLNAVWEYYRDHKKWIPTRLLHHQMKKEIVLAALKPLGGTIVSKIWELNRKQSYQLKLLGVLLSDYGSEVEELLVRYFEYLRSEFQLNPEIEKIDSDAIKKGLQLTDGQTQLMGQLIYLGQFWGGDASFGEKRECDVPRDIDDLPDITDLRRYVQEKVIESYDPKAPVEPDDQLRYSLTKGSKKAVDNFDFIQDPLLRDQLARDWDEAQRVHQVKAWKSCVILCGGILEGMLLDILKRDEQQAKTAYQKKKLKSSPDLNSWDLVDLVDVAKELGLLSKGVGHLSHGLREFRNLVHPGRQIRERVSLTEEEAEIAFRVVQVCLREFSSRFLKT